MKDNINLTIGCVTYKRPQLFESFLNSYLESKDQLLKQFPDLKTNLVIVDNNLQSYNENNYVSNFIDKLNNQEVLIIKGDGTASKGRNLIVSNSNSDWILFVDDDCTLTPNSLKIAIKTILKPLPFCCVGFIGDVRRQVDSKNILDVAYLKSGMDHYFSYNNNLSLAKRFKKVRWGPTALILLRKKHFIPFPEDLSIPVGGEDVLWGYELTIGNKYFFTLGDLVVNHICLNNSTKDTYKKVLSKSFRYGRSECLLAQKYKKASNLYSIKVLTKGLFYVFFATLVPYSMYANNVNLLSKSIRSAFLLGNIYQSLIFHKFPRTISLTSLSQDL